MKVNIVNKVDCKISEKAIRDSVISVLRNNNASADSEVSIAIARDDELTELAARYRREDGEEAKSHPVLSFSTKEAKNFVFPKKQKNYLGEIVISWDKALAESKNFDRSPEDIVCDYAAHGTLHLLGIHHK